MKLFYILAALTLFVSCDNDKNETPKTCTFNDSIDSYPWIVELKNAMTNCTCEVSIIQGSYHHQTVIFVAVTDPLCNSLNTPTLFNCDGKPIKSFSNSASDQKDLTDNVTRDEILYRCKS